MPSDNNKELSIKESSDKKKKHHKSIGWIIGVVVLILISITFIFPATGISSGNNSIVFGSYNGENIELSYGNYFYNQLNAIASSSQNADTFTVYYQAFYSTVFETALRQMAEKAGIKATDAMVNSAIKSNSSFHDANGNYDPELYRNTAAFERNLIGQQMSEALPAQKAFQDISGVKTSSNETAFVETLNNEDVRGFEYVLVDYNTYPDEDARAYAESNPAPFQTASLTFTNYSTEEEARTALSSGNDIFADKTSAETYFYNLESSLYQKEQAAVIFALAEGDVSEPVQTWYGWTVYRMDKAAADADLSKPETLSAVKSYISTNDTETMNGYLSAKADEVYQALLADEEKAVGDFNLTVNTVSASSPNPASSQFIIGPEYGDVKRALVSAASMDEEYYKTLFTSETGTILPPQTTGTSGFVIARPVEPEGNNEVFARYLTSMYESYIPDITAMDLQTSITTSDKFVDNFYTAFFSASSAV